MHPEIGLPKNKVYLGGMSILSILLSLEPGCHNTTVKSEFKMYCKYRAN
jgi:hypothetical protein